MDDRLAGLIDPHTCKHCGERGRVIDSRVIENLIKRRRQCDACNWRWNSYESLIDPRTLQDKAQPQDVV